MSKIDDLYNQIIMEKIGAVMESIKKRTQLDKEMHINIVEMRKIIERLEQQNLKQNKHFIYDHDMYDDYEGEPWYLAINDKNTPICFHENYGTCFSSQGIINVFGEEFLEQILAMEQIDIKELTTHTKFLTGEGTDKVSEATKKEIEEATGYSFEQFIKDSIPQALGEKRPVAICKDGTEYSIQASSFHACSPREDGLEAYDEFEIYALENWDDLEEFMNDDGVAGNVPFSVVEQILKEHGGLDGEKVMERIEEQKKIYKPKSEAYEKMISDASGGNEFLEKILRYATRRMEVRETGDKAKQLSEEYEEQLPKIPHSLDDNN